MIFIVVSCCLVVIFLAFSKKRKQERARLLALARAKRIEKIEFLCKRAREMPDDKIGRYQVWWGKTHEIDVALKKYYVY